MIERRTSPRHPLQMRTEVIQEGLGDPFGLLRANIGFGGLGGYGGIRVEADKALSIHLYFPQRSGEVKLEAVSGKVIWSHRDGNFNALGIAFSSLSQKEQPLLFSYLQYADQFE